MLRASPCRYWTILTPAHQTRTMELMTAAMVDMLAVVRAPLAGGATFADPRDAALAAGRLRNAYKAFTFLFSTAVQVAEKTQPSVEGGVLVAVTGGKATKGRGGKATAAKRPKASEEGDDGDEGAGGDASGQPFEWAALRPAACAALVSAVSVDFRKMWSMGLPEEVRVSCELR
jgi:hypothetical protein